MQLGAVTPPRCPFVIVLGNLGTRFEQLHTTPTGSRSLSWVLELSHWLSAAAPSIPSAW